MSKPKQQTISKFKLTKTHYSNLNYLSFELLKSQPNKITDIKTCKTHNSYDQNFFLPLKYVSL